MPVVVAQEAQVELPEEGPEEEGVQRPGLAVVEQLLSALGEDESLAPGEQLGEEEDVPQDAEPEGVALVADGEGGSGAFPSSSASSSSSATMRNCGTSAATAARERLPRLVSLTGACSAT